MTIFGTPFVIKDDHRYWVLLSLKYAEAFLIRGSSRHYLPGVNQTLEGFFQVLEIMKYDNDFCGAEDLYTDNRQAIGLCSERYQARRVTWEAMFQEIRDWPFSGGDESREKRIEFVQECLREESKGLFEKSRLVILLTRLIETVKALPKQ